MAFTFFARINYFFPESFKKKIFKDKNIDTGGTH